MKKTEPQPPNTFGDVDTNAEHGIFVVGDGRGRSCQLTLIGHTERGYPRRELASIPGKVWKEIAVPVQNELVRGMEGRGDSKAGPKLVAGENALSPLMVRELAVLLWALMEDEDDTHTDAILAGWKQLACEERWWLYARASSPAQQQGRGWRRALFFALNDPADTRTMVRPVSPKKRTAKKKSPAKTLTRSSGSSGTVQPNLATEASRVSKRSRTPQTPRPTTPTKKKLKASTKQTTPKSAAKKTNKKSQAKA